MNGDCKTCCSCLPQEDAEKFLAICKELNAGSANAIEELNEDVLKEFSYQSRGDICPIQAFIGGITAQEVMKVSFFGVESLLD